MIRSAPADSWQICGARSRPVVSFSWLGVLHLAANQRHKVFTTATAEVRVEARRRHVPEGAQLHRHRQSRCVFTQRACRAMPQPPGRFQPHRYEEEQKNASQAADGLNSRVAVGVTLPGASILGFLSVQPSSIRTRISHSTYGMQSAVAGVLGLQNPSGWASFTKLQPGAVRVPRYGPISQVHADTGSQVNTVFSIVSYVVLQGVPKP